jgi:hypothetical protein
MKLLNTLFLSLLVTLCSYAQTDAIERFFADYKNNDNFTEVYVSPKMFQMISKATNAAEEADLAQITKDLKGLRILTTTVNPMKIYKEANLRLPVKEYEELVTVKEKSSTVRFVTKESNGIITELLLLVGATDNFTMMSFVGKIDLAKISRLAKKIDIDGVDLDILEKANKGKKS